MTANPTEIAALRADWDRIQHYGPEMYMAATMGFVRRLLNELALATASSAIPSPTPEPEPRPNCPTCGGPCMVRFIVPTEREALTRSSIDHWLRHRNLTFTRGEGSIGYGRSIDAIMGLLEYLGEMSGTRPWPAPCAHEWYQTGPDATRWACDKCKEFRRGPAPTDGVVHRAGAAT